MRSLNFLLNIFLISNVGGRESFEELISRTNIYYQRPAYLGTPREVVMSNIKQLSSSRNEIKVIVHGYLASRTHSTVVTIRNAYLAKAADNIYMADWSSVANFDYATTRNAIGRVAVVLETILSDFMHKHDIQPRDVHIIGHSLGAHISGLVGRLFNGSLGRVTGLDPALPLFTPHSDDGLHLTAANFVDVIHTDHPYYGDFTPRGHADFYPNFGQAPQIGCKDLITASTCSHFRAVFYYAESIGVPSSFPSIPCSLPAIKLHRKSLCAQNILANGKQPELVMMGEYVTRNATGSYFLETNGEPPFGKGNSSEWKYAINQLSKIQTK